MAAVSGMAGARGVAALALSHSPKEQAQVEDLRPQVTRPGGEFITERNLMPVLFAENGTRRKLEERPTGQIRQWAMRSRYSTHAFGRYGKIRRLGS